MLFFFFNFFLKKQFKKVLEQYLKDILGSEEILTFEDELRQWLEKVKITFNFFFFLKFFFKK